MSLVTALVALTALALGALLAAEYRQARTLVWVAKPLASSGFVATALAAGALDSLYGRWVLGALALCWIGDVLLIPRGARAAFATGASSFLLGHVAYAIAFLALGVDPWGAAVAAIVLAPPAAFVLRWLRGRVPEGLRPLVHAYVVVISGMVALAAGTLVLPIGVGASMFWLSDLAVARDRFGSPSFGNKVWGLPLYYGGQLVLSLTAG